MADLALGPEIDFPQPLPWGDGFAGSSPGAPCGERAATSSGGRDGGHQEAGGCGGSHRVIFLCSFHRVRGQRFAWMLKELHGGTAVAVETGKGQAAEDDGVAFTWFPDPQKSVQTKNFADLPRGPLLSWTGARAEGASEQRLRPPAHAPGLLHVRAEGPVGPRWRLHTTALQLLKM